MMSWETISYRLEEAVREKGLRVAPKDFRTARGCCRACRSRTFDAVLERTVDFKNDQGPGTAKVAIKALADVPLPTLPGAQDRIILPPGT